MMGQQTMMVKRTLLLLTAMVAALLVASGTAIAAATIINCATQESPLDNTCSGDANDNIIFGTSSAEEFIYALGGNDLVVANPGNDKIFGSTASASFGDRRAGSVAPCG